MVAIGTVEVRGLKVVPYVDKKTGEQKTFVRASVELANGADYASFYVGVPRGFEGVKRGDKVHLGVEDRDGRAELTIGPIPAPKS